jgi:hypothetical protein
MPVDGEDAALLVEFIKDVGFVKHVEFIKHVVA